MTRASQGGHVASLESDEDTVAVEAVLRCDQYRGHRPIVPISFRFRGPGDIRESLGGLCRAGARDEGHPEPDGSCATPDAPAGPRRCGFLADAIAGASEGVVSNDGRRPRANVVNR